jgi:hypothetical protein
MEAFLLLWMVARLLYPLHQRRVVRQRLFHVVLAAKLPMGPAQGTVTALLAAAYFPFCKQNLYPKCPAATKVARRAFFLSNVANAGTIYSYSVIRFTSSPLGP